MVGTSENIGNYKQRTVRVTPLLVCIWDCICNGSKRCYRGNGGQSIAAQEDAFMGVFINDEKQFRQKIRAVPGKRKYIIYQQESAETVRIRLVKLTEEQYGKVWITNLITDAPVTRDAIPSRHLLFIGDSLTAGYGVDGINGISAFRTADEDVTKTYASRNIFPLSILTYQTPLH